MDLRAQKPFYGIMAPSDPMPKLAVERGPDRGKSVEVTPETIRGVGYVLLLHELASVEPRNDT